MFLLKGRRLDAEYSTFFTLSREVLIIGMFKDLYLVRSYNTAKISPIALKLAQTKQQLAAHKVTSAREEVTTFP